MPTSTAADLSLRQLAERDERPFPPQPLVARYFPAAAIEDARRRLTRAIDRGDGPGLVVGGAGIGKSLLLQVLAAQFRERFDVVLLGCARVCTRRALLQAILFELGLPYRFRDEGQLRFSLLDHLLSSQQPPTELLLLVDEAQSLSVTLLDELRVLTNLVHGGKSRIRLVIAGSLALEETFASPELESLSQRLAARCYLTAFSRDETAQFMRAQLAASRAAVDDVLRPEAWEAVFEATDGVPRLVNQLCDRAITVAVARNCSRIDRRVVQEAWADLQQLPSPWQSAVAATSEEPSVIEFGGLAPVEREPVQEVSLQKTVEVGAREPAAVQVSPSPISAPAQPPRIVTDSKNPFSEAFDEEEVVIDGFASFDLWRSGVPRVENLRDSKFAELVRAAIDVSAEHIEVDRTEAEVVESIEHKRSSVQTPVMDSAASEPIETGEFSSREVLAAEIEDELDESEFHWPPIRLAFPDPVESGASAPNSPLSQHLHGAYAQERDNPWQEFPEAYEDTGRDGIESPEPPIIVVEEEHPTACHDATLALARPQVRRQEYRRLFSRLRSG
jgi:type II secretory pathway predicted ATPase ExeA